jgi:hypothetical protein
MSFCLRGAHGKRAFPANFESGDAARPAPPLSRVADAGQSGRLNYLEPDAVASTHLAADAARILGSLRQQNRRHLLDPRRVGEDQLGIRLAPLLHLFRLPSRLRGHQQDHREREHHGFENCLHGF